MLKVALLVVMLVAVAGVVLPSSFALPNPNDAVARIISGENQAPTAPDLVLTGSNALRLINTWNLYDERYVHPDNGTLTLGDDRDDISELTICVSIDGSTADPPLLRVPRITGELIDGNRTVSPFTNYADGVQLDRCIRHNFDDQRNLAVRTWHFPPVYDNIPLVKFPYTVTDTDGASADGMIHLTVKMPEEKITPKGHNPYQVKSGGETKISTNALKRAFAFELFDRPTTLGSFYSDDFGEKATARNTYMLNNTANLTMVAETANQNITTTSISIRFEEGFMYFNHTGDVIMNNDLKVPVQIPFDVSHTMKARNGTTSPVLNIDRAPATGSAPLNFEIVVPVCSATAESALDFGGIIPDSFVFTGDQTLIMRNTGTDEGSITITGIDWIDPDHADPDNAPAIMYTNSTSWTEDPDLSPEQFNNVADGAAATVYVGGAAHPLYFALEATLTDDQSDYVGKVQQTITTMLDCPEG